MDKIFLESIIQQFTYYKQLGENTFAQLEDTQLFVQVNSDSNSVAMLVQHLHGNMLSRWTDFLVTDGEKPWRNRDQEFEIVIKTRTQMLDKWAEGWECLLSSLHKLDIADLNLSVFIRGEKLAVIEAINRQFAHYCYHVGQIVYLGKMFANNGWQSLTIPKGDSARFNEELFKQQKIGES